jgi:hypothetical protein
LSGERQIGYKQARKQTIWKKKMKPTFFLLRAVKLRAHVGVALLVAAILFCGCQAKPAPLSPEAASFKQAIKDCLHNLSTTLMDPVAKKDLRAITAALEKIESPAVKLCSMCPFQIGVLNKFGEGLAIYPPRAANNKRNYSSYDLVTKALNTKKIQQKRFYLQDGTELYIICAPLVRQGNVIGLVAIAVNSEDAEKRWGITGKDFLALDFNA